MSTDLFQQGRNCFQNAGEGSAWAQDMGVYARRVEKVTAGDVVTFYKGFAEWGSSESDPVWRVYRMTLDTSSELVVEEMIAQGGEFTVAWDNRVNEVYS